jgi:hypothetical protein
MGSAIDTESMTLAERFLRRADRLQTFMLHTAALAKTEPEKFNPMTQEARAGVIVYSMAELEALTTSLLLAVNRAINAQKLPHVDLLPSLRSLADHSTFESLRIIKDADTVWTHRAMVTSYEARQDLVQLPAQEGFLLPPLDGRTLTPAHFQRIWNVYGLTSEIFPPGANPMTLTKLSLVRNDLAHGNIPFFQVFQQPGYTVTQVERYLSEMCLFAIHLAATLANYVDSGGYRSA